MEDIVPKLLTDILDDFETMVDNNEKIQKVLHEDIPTITMEEISDLAGELGHYAAICLQKNYNENTLPEGILYWNIAKRTISPLMKRVYELVIQMAEVVQKKEDVAVGIGIKPIRPEFNEERIEAVINKVVRVSLFQEVPRNE